MNFLYYSFLLLFLVLSCFLILLVLIQKGRGGGLSAAFGGVGGNTAFGAKTGDVLTWATSIVFGVFLLLAIGMNLVANNIHHARTQIEMPAATTAPTETVSDILGKSPLAPPANSATPSTQPTPAVVPSTGPAGTN